MESYVPLMVSLNCSVNDFWESGYTIAWSTSATSRVPGVTRSWSVPSWPRPSFRSQAACQCRTWWRECTRTKGSVVIMRSKGKKLQTVEADEGGLLYSDCLTTLLSSLHPSLHNVGADADVIRGYICHDEVVDTDDAPERSVSYRSWVLSGFDID